MKSSVTVGEHVFLAETEMIDVTRGPTVNDPGDYFRRLAPGMTSYYIDGEEVTKKFYEAKLLRALAREEARGSSR